MSDDDCPVELRWSTVCEGWGVFATRDIARGECVTAYVGELVDNTTWNGEADYALKLDDTWTLVGESDPAKLCNAGIAQMANDAIHREVSGRSNNCDFRIVGTSAFLRTTREVRRDDEMLVDYHISYWLARSSSKTLPKETRTWLRCHKRVISSLEAMGCTVDRYVLQRERADDLNTTADDGDGGHGGHGVFVYGTDGSDMPASIPCTCAPSSGPQRHRRRGRKVNVHLYKQDSGVPLMEVACAHCDDT